MGKSEFRRQEPHRKAYPSICWPSSPGVVISSTLGGFGLSLVTQQRCSMIDVPGRGLKTPSYGSIKDSPLSKSALRSCSTKDVASMSASAHAGCGAACLIRPSSQHIARFRKPELLLRMLLIRNVLAAAVSRKQSIKRSKTLARRMPALTSAPGLTKLIIWR